MEGRDVGIGGNAVVTHVCGMDNGAACGGVAAQRGPGDRFRKEDETDRYGWGLGMLTDLLDNWFGECLTHGDAEVGWGWERRQGEAD